MRTISHKLVVELKYLGGLHRRYILNKYGIDEALLLVKYDRIRYDRITDQYLWKEGSISQARKG